MNWVEGDTDPQIIQGGNLRYGHVYEEFWKDRQQTRNSSYLPLAGVRNIGMDTGVGERLPIVFLLIVLMFEQCWYNTDFQNLHDFYFEKYMPMVKEKKNPHSSKAWEFHHSWVRSHLILLFSVPGLTPPLLCPFPNVISLKLPVLCCGWEKYSQSPAWWGGRSLTFPYTDPHTAHTASIGKRHFQFLRTTLASVVGSSLVLGGFQLCFLLVHLPSAFRLLKLCWPPSSEVVSSPIVFFLINFDLSYSWMGISGRLWEGAEIKWIRSAMPHGGPGCFPGI